MRTIILLPFILLSCLQIASPPAAPGQVRGPLLEISPSPVDFDTVSCGSSRCMDIILRNTGDTALTVQEFSVLNTPFEGGVTTPFILQPNEEHSTQWCYRPVRVRGRDSIRVAFTSDNRIRYSFGLLTDMSTAMDVAFPGAGNAMEAARGALDRFVATMMEDGSPQHEGAVFAYSTTSRYRLLRAFSEDRDMLRSSLPGTTSGDHACIWHGMDRTIGLMQGNKHKRLLIVINGSSDAGLQNCGPYSAAGVADAVTAADMMVCAISIDGAASTALAGIAQQSGGIHRDVSSQQDLDGAIHDIILHLQRAVRQTLTVSGEVVSPSLAFSPDAVFFPSTAVGDTLSMEVLMRNVGTAPMDLGTLHGETTEFTLSFPPEQVAAGAEVKATLFFHPTRQGYEKTQLSVDINGCDPSRPVLLAHGVAFNRVAMTFGPVLVTGEERIDAGAVNCAGEHRIGIPVRNAGDQPLTLSDPQVIDPRLIVEPLPTPLAGGVEDTITLRLHPDGMLGRDSATFTCAAEVRRTTHTLVLIDAASRLRWLSERGQSGEDMSSAVIGLLLGGLVTSEELQDKMGVLSVNRTDVSTLQSMTESRTDLAGVHPSAGNSDTTALPHGIAAAIDSLRKYDGIRRLVIVTAGSRIDGADSTLPHIAGLAERAMEYDIHVSAFSPMNSLSADTLDSFLDMIGVERILLTDL
ncbi:MAG: choice-of-anchor D domain-containing protein, partial [Bacteroidetes bacterium]|nr:choice-of-anchor D domain-containing protein [Bacteroidota bacterium]